MQIVMRGPVHRRMSQATEGEAGRLMKFDTPIMVFRDNCFHFFFSLFLSIYLFFVFTFLFFYMESHTDMIMIVQKLVCVRWAISSQAQNVI